jgi:hypothetical protein
MKTGLVFASTGAARSASIVMAQQCAIEEVVVTATKRAESRGETEGPVLVRGIGSVAPGIGADPAVGTYSDSLYAGDVINIRAWGRLLRLQASFNF